jgi:hypothetical protein
MTGLKRVVAGRYCDAGAFVRPDEVSAQHGVTALPGHCAQAVVERGDRAGCLGCEQDAASGQFKPVSARN